MKIILNRDRVAAPQKVQAVDSGSPGNREGKGVSQRTGEVTIPPGNPGTKRKALLERAMKAARLKRDGESDLLHAEEDLVVDPIDLRLDVIRVGVGNVPMADPFLLQRIF